MIYATKTLSIYHHVVNKSAQGEENDFEINCVLSRWIQIRVCTPFPSKIQTLYSSGLTIWIGSLRVYYAHRKIRESLLGSAVVGRCPDLSNQCKFGLANQMSGRHITATELELNRFWHFPFGGLVWHLSTEVNNIDLDAYITVFSLRRGKRGRFIPFLVYALVYRSIPINLMTLATLNPWSDSIRTHAYYTFLRKRLLKWTRMVETRLLINC